MRDEFVDDLRRGRPTLHVHAGEAMAILAGDALTSLAFELVAGAPLPDDRRVPLVAELARATTAMIEGQVHDTLGDLPAALADADVVIASHVGLDGLSSLGDIWNGSITGRHIYLDFRRVPRTEVPSDRAGRINWLMAEWQKVDDWIGQRRDA